MSERYYACMAREVREVDGRQRIGLEFEIVAEEYLNAFLGKENGKRQAFAECEEVFDSFRQYGMSDERFQKVKGRYLGGTGFQMLTVYFETMEYARYREENWYYIQLAGKGRKEELIGTTYDCALYDWGETGDPVINACCCFIPQSHEQAIALKRLYHPYIPAEGRWDGNVVNAIGGGTVFQWVRFYYVGAALCAGIFDSGNHLTAFFDLGTRVSQNPLIAAQQPAAMNSNAAIIGTLGNIGEGFRVTIFISHWHDDHCNALAPFVRNGTFANIARSTEWFVPASNRVSFQSIQALVPAQLFHVYQAVQQPVNIHGNPNIQIGKIDYWGLGHPHHQGMYARVRLRSGTEVLLAGDTTYDGMPPNVRTNGGNGYDCLQVCHHGGNYNITHPGTANLPQAEIPDAAGGAIAVYSADGVYHGHPDGRVVGNHRNRGYVQNNEWQLQQMAAAGNNILDIV